ncbi:MAG: hypothetical protein U1F24_07790 [Alphaproteobacteria bacterium]
MSVHRLDFGPARSLFSGAPAMLSGAGDDPAGAVTAASMIAPGVWHVFAAEGTLHLHLPPGAAVPPEAGPADLVWETARALSAPEGGAPLRASVAVARGATLDAAAAIAPLGGDAAGLAAALADLPAPPLEPGIEAIWERLSHVARRAQALKKEGRLAAAALACRGRGRLIGGLSGDLLIRFGVSAWR